MTGERNNASPKRRNVTPDYIHQRITHKFWIYPKKISELSQILDALSAILTQIGMDWHIEYLSQIMLAAERSDVDAFNKYVLSNSLFGGAGAIWEIWSEDKIRLKEFEFQFCKFIDCLKKIGIKDGRIDQVRNYLVKLGET